MQPPTPPNAVEVEVVATQPTAADNAAIDHLTTTAGRALTPVTYLVKVRLDPMPPVTSMGWALYVDDFRIPKYWEYPEGIYFTMVDPQFFEDHRGGVENRQPDYPVEQERVDTGAQAGWTQFQHDAFGRFGCDGRVENIAHALTTIVSAILSCRHCCASPKMKSSSMIQ